MPPCAACARADAYNLCAGCRFVSYCDARCQKAHWAAHKVICKAVRADAARNPAWKATTCDACAATLVGVGQRCSGCYSAEYCDAACQLAHWTREHRAVCKAVGEASFARMMTQATAGDEEMMYNVGIAYTTGTGVAVDERAAFEWFRRAAEAGDVDAQCCLGLAYKYGKGVTADPRKAFAWWRRAADAGNASAMCLLGWCYKDGSGVDADPHAAVKWYRRAAGAGYARASFNVGCVYADGFGVARDLREARRWFERAADAGVAEATAALAELDALKAD
jgi:TPR repeat protein